MSFASCQRAAALCSVAIMCAAIVGCGESTGSVRGKIYYQDKALTGGMVAFIPKNDKVATTPIQPDGSYELTKVPTGVAKISVSGPAKMNIPKGMVMDPGKMGVKDKVAAPPSDPAQIVTIPEKYADADKSGLTFDVKSGSNQHDIKLAP